MHTYVNIIGTRNWQSSICISEPVLFITPPPPNKKIQMPLIKLKQWTNGVVPYAISGPFTSDDKKVIRAAMKVNIV